MARIMKLCTAFLVASAGGLLVNHRSTRSRVAKGSRVGAAARNMETARYRTARSVAGIGRALRHATKHIELEADRVVAAQDLLSREAALVRASDPFGATLLDGFIQVPTLVPMLMMDPSPYAYIAPEHDANVFAAEEPEYQDDEHNLLVPASEYEDDGAPLGFPSVLDQAPLEDETAELAFGESVESVTRTDAFGRVIHSVRRCEDDRCTVTEEVVEPDSTDEVTHSSVYETGALDDHDLFDVKETSQEFADTLKSAMMDGVGIDFPLTGNRTEDLERVAPALQRMKELLESAGMGIFAGIIDGVLFQNTSIIKQGLASAGSFASALMSDFGMAPVGDLLAAAMEGNETKMQLVAPTALEHLAQQMAGAAGRNSTAKPNYTQDMATFMQSLLHPLVGGGAPAHPSNRTTAVDAVNLTRGDGSLQGVASFLPLFVASALRAMTEQGFLWGTRPGIGSAPWDSLMTGLSSLAVPGMLGLNGKDSDSESVEESIIFDNGKMVKSRRICRAGRGCEEETSEVDSDESDIPSGRPAKNGTASAVTKNGTALAVKRAKHKKSGLPAKNGTSGAVQQVAQNKSALSPNVH